jgi:hypothetical protein
VVDPRIPGNAWYLFADPSQYHALEFAELDGSRSDGGTGPRIESRVGFETLGLEIRCLYDVGAGAVAFQPAVLNPGA